MKNYLSYFFKSIIIIIGSVLVLSLLIGNKFIRGYSKQYIRMSLTIIYVGAIVLFLILNCSYPFFLLKTKLKNPNKKITSNEIFNEQFIFIRNTLNSISKNTFRILGVVFVLILLYVLIDAFLK